MISVSENFLQKMEFSTSFMCAAHIVFANGEELDIGEEDFWTSGNSITDGSGKEGIPIGVAVGKSIKIELINSDDKYSKYSFVGAKIILYVSFEGEKVSVGKFTVVEPETKDETVSIYANDNMYLFDKEYVTSLTFPATARDIFVDACKRCGVEYDDSNINNGDFVVNAKPYDVTFRDVIGMVSMLSGGNAKINADGIIKIIPYNFDEAPKQTFSDWFSLSDGIEDIEITGVSAKKAEYINGEVVASAILEGNEGYVLNFENQMIEGKESDFLSMIAPIFLGKKFRRFSGEHAANPIAEFMDTINVVNINGDVFTTFITDIEFSFLGSSNFKNSAMATAIVNSKYDVKQNTDKKIDSIYEDLMAQISRTETGLALEVAKLQAKVDLTMSSEEVKITVQNAIGKIDSVRIPNTGYTFDANGLKIQQEDEEMESLLDNEGLSVKRGAADILTAKGDGVNAINVRVEKYLTIGNNSRFENYETNRTACFYIGD